MTSTKICSQRVHAIFEICKLKDEEEDSDHLEVKGDRIVWFDPDRLRSHGEEISSFLEQLPDEFKRSGGGGASFLNAYEDIQGDRWTKDNEIIHELFELGIGIGKARLIEPKGLSSIASIGKPYYIID